MITRKDKLVYIIRFKSRYTFKQKGCRNTNRYIPTAKSIKSGNLKYSTNTFVATSLTDQSACSKLTRLVKNKEIIKNM